jgi:hypothetical protein
VKVLAMGEPAVLRTKTPGLWFVAQAVFSPNTCATVIFGTRKNWYLASLYPPVGLHLIAPSTLEGNW